MLKSIGIKPSPCRISLCALHAWDMNFSFLAINFEFKYINLIILYKFPPIFRSSNFLNKPECQTESNALQKSTKHV